MTKLEIDALKIWTVEELKAELERLEKEIFMVNMIDHWNFEDDCRHSTLTRKQYFVREELRSR